MMKRTIMTMMGKWCVFCFVLPSFATTTIVSVEPTHMQAKVNVLTDQAGFCSYRASRGTSFVAGVPDLSDNGNTDARTGAIVNGNKHIFVLGTRKGSDALAAAATYWVGVTCGSDSEVSTTFATLPIPWGNMAPNPVPFNPAAFGNMDYPVINWTNQTQSYVDPVSGIEFWRLTSPGQVGANAGVALYNTTSGAPIDLTGSGWSNVSSAAFNAAPNPTAYATASGSSTNKVFIPLGPPGYPLPPGNWSPNATIDDVIAHVYCGSASQAGITFSLAWTTDGGQTVAGTPVTTAACPSSSPSKIGDYPQSAPIPMLQGWGLTRPQAELMAPTGGSASVAGSVVTAQNPGGSSSLFTTDWAANTPILINGSVYHVASVQSPVQLTLVENPGTLTNVSWASINAGVVVWKNGAGTANVSLGLDVYTSSNANPGDNAAGTMVNSAPPVNVTVAANGTPLGYTLQGYMFVASDFGGSGSILLWIPENQDGTPRNEVRLLSIGLKSASSPTVNLQGDAAAYPYNVGVQPSHLSAFDNVNGDRFYAISHASDGKSRLWRMSYNPGGTTNGVSCVGFPAYNPYPLYGGYSTSLSGGSITDDCFQYTNLTPSSANLDIQAQIKLGYQTCANSSGASVCPYPHPGFDTGWFPNTQMDLTTSGYLTAEINTEQNEPSIFGAFDINTGLLTAVRDTWGSDPDTEARWGGEHSMAEVSTTYVWITGDVLNGGGTSTVFGMANFTLPIDQINRAGFGSTANWDANAALASQEAYACPPDSQFPTRYQIASMRALGYTGPQLGGSVNCIQVQFHTPPCNPTPNTTYTFPDGNTEVKEFPCATPGFGIADPTKSKLMDMRPGDWMYVASDGPGGERWMLISVNYSGTNVIQAWLLRWARHNYLNLFFNDGDDKANALARSNGWYLTMAPTLSTTCLSAALDTSAGAAARWISDNPDRQSCHGAMGAGLSPGHFTFAEPCNPPTYTGNYNMTPASMIFAPFTPMGASVPSFAGSGNGIYALQSYGSGSYLPGTVSPPFQLDFRHVNGSFGSGPEVLNSIVGNSRTLTQVAGTSNTYLIQDAISSGPSDYKRLPLHGWAGRFLLKDVSNPSTTNTIDFPNYSLCRAFNANECFVGSTVGNLYVTAPRAYVDGQCHSDTFALTAPCVGQLGPITGQVTQFRVDRADATGATVRTLGYVHGMPGLQYQFSNCRATPDAAYAFCVADWLDGVRSEWVALRISPLPTPDTVNRTTFVPITLTYQGSPDASYIRARFGYLENGGSLLQCTAYQVQCSTEIPSGSPTDPYSFTNETVTRQSCPNGSTCTITIPAISQRMLYYVVDRLDSNGNIVTSYPMVVVAVP